MPIRVNLPDGRVVHFPDGMPPEQIQAEVQKLAPTEPQRALIDIDTNKVSSAAQRGLDVATDALPNIGGMAGSMAGRMRGGGLGATVGAGLGGAAGDALRQGADAIRGRGEPQSLTQRVASVGAAGGVQAGLEGVGRGIVEPAAKAVYGLALRPLKALRDKYGLVNLVKAGFEGRVMPTAGGAAKATEQMQASRAAQEGMAQHWDDARARLGPAAKLPVADAIRRGVSPVMKEASGIERATGVTGTRQRIAGQVKGVTARNPARVSATQMMALKRSADDVADPAYVAASKGGQPVLPGSEPAIAKGFSKGYRGTLNDAIGPEFAAQGQKTKTLYGLSRAAQYAGERPEAASNIMSLVGGAASGGGDLGESIKNGMVMRALLSPRMQAGAALAATPTALYGTRGLDAATGSHLEEALREALRQQLMGAP